MYKQKYNKKNKPFKYGDKTRQSDEYNNIKVLPVKRRSRDMIHGSTIWTNLFIN